MALVFRARSSFRVRPLLPSRAHVVVRHPRTDRWRQKPAHRLAAVGFNVVATVLSSVGAVRRGVAVLALNDSLIEARQKGFTTCTVRAARRRRYRMISVLNRMSAIPGPNWV